MSSRHRRSRLKRARALGAADWSALLEAWVSLAAVWTALRLVAAGRLIARCEAVSASAPSGTRQARRVVRRVARLVAMAASRHVVPMGCLPQSLAVSRMLGRRGIPTTVRLGVRLVDSELRAHAWTEWQGRAVTGRRAPQEQYAPLSTVGLGAANGSRRGGLSDG